MSRARIAILQQTQPAIDEVLDAASIVGLTARLATCQLQLTSPDVAPEWIELVPAGQQLEALDGRKFVNPSPEAVVERFNAHPIDLPLDWEHSTEVKAPKGDEAPAAGWIKALKVIAGAIHARIEWTKRGAASVCSKEYRYVSPAFTYNKAREILAIASAGLTNHPALVMKALSSVGAAAQGNNKEVKSLTQDPVADDPHNSQLQGDPMDPELKKILGLNDDADAKAVCAAVKSLVEKHALLSTNHEAMLKVKASAEQEVATLRAQTPDLKTFVPRADHDLALARIATLEADVTDRKQAQLKDTIEVELTAALKAGKIAPATVEVHRAMCAREGGLEDFRKLVAVAPILAPDKIPQLDRQVPGAGEVVLTSADRKVMAATGVSEDEYKAGAKKLATLRKQRAGEEDDE
jgi:phage I-like protein